MNGIVICQFRTLCHKINPILPEEGGGGGGQNTPLLFFLRHPKTAQGIKLKLSDFKDAPPPPGPECI